MHNTIIIDAPVDKPQSQWIEPHRDYPLPKDDRTSCVNFRIMAKTKSQTTRWFLRFALVVICWVSCSASTASWQSPSDHTAIDEAARYQDFPVTVFSPTGRLFPVEAALQASKEKTRLSNLVVACKCRDGIVVVSTLPVSAHLYTNTTTNSSLFLLDETSGPIFDIHPCVIGATAGNAVDNRIMKSKLLALGMAALSDQGSLEQDISSGKIAKDLANQLQVLTQDIGASQKQRLGRMLASTAVILGSRKIWRMDPTGQFWDCHATVVGEDADRNEELFHKRLLDECETKQSPQQLLESLSPTQALELIQDFLGSKVQKQQEQEQRMRSTEKTSDESTEPDRLSQVFWQAAILDYSSMTKRGTPQRTWKKGVFGIRG